MTEFFMKFPHSFILRRRKSRDGKFKITHIFLWVKSCLIKAWHNLNLLIIAVGNMEKSLDVAPPQKKRKKKSLALSPKK